MILPKYLKKNSFKIYYFRIKVPKKLTEIIGKTEICRSLKTRCRMTATLRALSLADEAGRMFDRVACDAGITYQSYLVRHREAHLISLGVEKCLPRSGGNSVQINDTSKIRKERMSIPGDVLLLSTVIKKYVDTKEKDGTWKAGEKVGIKKFLRR